MKLFSRVENWLLIVPLILAVIEVLIIGRSTFDLHIHDTYFVIENSHTWLIFFIILLLPYLCHRVLRAKQKRNKTVCIIHIASTLVLLAVFLNYTRIPRSLGGMPRRYYDYSAWEFPMLFGNSYSGEETLTFGLFLFIQLAFIFYTVIRFILPAAKPGK